jgi:hypothetical protein
MWDNGRTSMPFVIVAFYSFAHYASAITMFKELDLRDVGGTYFSDVVALFWRQLDVLFYDVQLCASVVHGNRWAGGRAGWRWKDAAWEGRLEGWRVLLRDRWGLAVPTRVCCPGEGFACSPAHGTQLPFNLLRPPPCPACLLLLPPCCCHPATTRVLDGMTQLMFKGYEEHRVALVTLLFTMPCCILMGVEYAVFMGGKLDMVRHRAVTSTGRCELVCGILGCGAVEQAPEAALPCPPAPPCPALPCPAAP